MNCFRKAKFKHRNKGEKNSLNCNKVEDETISKSMSGGKYKKRTDVIVNNTNNHFDGQNHSKKVVIMDPKLEKSQQNSGWGVMPTENGKTEIGSMEIYGTSIQGVAYMPVSKHDPSYNMNHPRRGKAVIFNFDHWENTGIPDLDNKPRLGSQKDKHDLTQCLQKLDFDVESYDNCANLEMWKILKDLRKQDHSDADCLLIAIFTHGERNTIYVSDGTQIPVNLVWEYFEAHKCPSLAGKPKIFIVQACRGYKYDNGTALSPPGQRYEAHAPPADVTDSASFSYVIPNAADILVAFSSPLGHYSWRNSEKGSWFIQSICKVFNDNAYSMDLQGLFTHVAREVALNYESYTLPEIETHKKKQVTSTSSTLIRTVSFAPKPHKSLIIMDGNNVNINVDFDNKVITASETTFTSTKEVEEEVPSDILVVAMSKVITEDVELETSTTNL